VGTLRKAQTNGCKLLKYNNLCYADGLRNNSA
jgi:hypothetical protein